MDLRMPRGGWVPTRLRSTARALGSRPTSDFVILAVGHALHMVAQLLALRVLTSFLSAAEAGRVYLLLGLATAFQLALIQPLATFGERGLLEWNQRGLARWHYRKLIGYASVCALAASVIVAALHRYIAPTLDASGAFLLLFVFFTLIGTLVSRNLLSGLNVLGYRKLFVVLMNLIPWGGIGLSLLLVLFYRPTAEAWLAGQVLAFGMVGSITLLVFFRRLAPHVGSQPATPQPRSVARSAFGFGWPLAIAAGLAWMQSQGYRFVLLDLAGADAVGVFAVGYAIGAGLMIAFETVFSQFYFPRFYRDIANADESGRTAAWNRYASAYLPAVVVMVGLVAAGGKLFVWLLADARFHAAAVVVAFAAIAEGLRMVWSTYYMAAIAERTMKLVLVPGVCGAAVALGAVWLLAPVDPLVGTGAALSLGALTQVVVMAGQFSQLPLILPWRRLAYAGAAVLPLVVGLYGGASLVAGQLPFVLSLLVLALIYVLLLQWRLTRAWLA